MSKEETHKYTLQYIALVYFGQAVCLQYKEDINKDDVFMNRMTYLFNYKESNLKNYFKLHDMKTANEAMKQVLIRHNARVAELKKSGKYTDFDETYYPIAIKAIFNLLPMDIFKDNFMSLNTKLIKHYPEFDSYPFDISEFGLENYHEMLRIYQDLTEELDSFAFRSNLSSKPKVSIPKKHKKPKKKKPKKLKTKQVITKPKPKLKLSIIKSLCLKRNINFVSGNIKEFDVEFKGYTATIDTSLGAVGALLNDFLEQVEEMESFKLTKEDIQKLVSNNGMELLEYSDETITITKDNYQAVIDVTEHLEASLKEFLKIINNNN